MEKADSMPLQEIFEELGSSPNGLTSEEAQNRIKTHGFNRLSEKKQASIFYKFIIHAKDLFGMLLLFASLLAFISGNSELGIVILGVVLLNIFFSMFQEARAEKAIQTLKRWIPEYTKVLRDGELTKVLVKEIVPGDIIILEEGDRVPADARLIEVFDLWTNNVPLTGESEPQPRSVEPSETRETAYIHSTNLVFMSTSVAKGQGKAVVITTGMNTQFGKIASLTQEVREEASPLHREIERMAKIDLVFALIVAVIFFLVSLLWLKVDFATSILFMIGIMICFVPEGLQVTVSSALAINVLKMVKENVLVKRLSAVQTLGSVTVICTDKTGTITKGEMTVKKLWINNQIVEVSGIGYKPIGYFTINGKRLKKSEVETTQQLLKISALCNGAKIDPPSDTNKSWNIIGDPTDGALMVAALKFDLNIKELLIEKPIINIIPFDFARKKMTTIHKVDDEVYVYTKGAPRNILSICNKIDMNGKTVNLTSENLCLVEKKLQQFAQEGLRVIAVAYKNISSNNYSKNMNVEKDMVFVGLAAMMDPPRLEVRDAVIKAKQAGIKTVIITGDYGPTAKFIAQEVGILTRDASTIIRGVDLDNLDDQAINDTVKTGNVIFARVSPEQKLRVVKVLKKNGEVVAVTGDGANDAPSLKEADVGISMGVSGTDVAREASDIVLLDDSFESIVKAVESGRVIYENIRKFIVYVFSHNWAEFIPYLLYATIGIPLPLLVVQILAIDLGIDVIPSLALSREPAELGIMEEPPRSIKERLFTAKVIARSIYIGIVIAIVAMYGCLSVWSSGGWSLGMPLASDDPIYIKGTTMVFAAIVVGQVGNVLTCRTNKQSIFKTSIKTNMWILLGIITQLSILSVLIYAPPLQSIFGTTALNIMDWAYLAMVPIAVIVAEEIRKFFSRRLSKKEINPMHDH
ncbi:MAG: cation-transporting P-type ATPase [Candidatus Bathyarchaeota archaeon]|nr:cation-transporting P-type ATPase [Candidatus Bathyarchaeum tardum]WGM89150.1 MAG: cation-transporting P-type ATPase [Candidatus Bathyarchaeum tardum]WNZ28612.1 MAG: cation-transporting P-type ATPase [Candidatus Bathyarchaeota archaeon]